MTITVYFLILQYTQTWLQFHHQQYILVISLVAAVATVVVTKTTTLKRVGPATCITCDVCSQPRPLCCFSHHSHAYNIQFIVEEGSQEDHSIFW